MPCKFCGTNWEKDVTNTELITVLETRKHEARKAYESYDPPGTTARRRQARRQLIPVLVVIVLASFCSLVYPVEIITYLEGLSSPYAMIVGGIPLAALVTWLLVVLHQISRREAEDWDAFEEEFPEHAEMLHHMNFR